MAGPDQSEPAAAGPAIPSHVTSRRVAWSGRTALPGTRELAEEVAVAISYNGSTNAVLMATPSDLEDLAVGFSVTEGIVETPAAIEAITIEAFDLGLDIQVRVRDDVAERLAARRRSMAGPVGCGMCGLESLEAATRSLPPVTATARFRPDDVTAAVAALATRQDLNRATGAAHAAGFFTADDGLVLAREDVGRHNALDKAIGAMLRAGLVPEAGGFVVTSRVSVELVQKTAAARAGLIAAVSAPTAYAVRQAEAFGVTLAAVVRGEAFEVFTHPHRIAPGAVADVA